MTTSSSGSVKWSQVSEDLVPVSITCVQPTIEGLAAAAAAAAQANAAAGGGAQPPAVPPAEQIVFHITAFNSQVEKILDVRLVQPGKWEQFNVVIALDYYLCVYYLVTSETTKETARKDDDRRFESFNDMQQRT